MNTHIVAVSLAGLFIFVLVWFTLKTGSAPMPTSRTVLSAMLSVLPERLPQVSGEHQPGVVAELGSGWGGVAFALAKRYPDHLVVGYELSPLPLLYSKLRQKLFPQKNLTFVRSDFMKIDLSSAVLAICYLAPESMVALRSKLDQELRLGTLVLTNTFSFRDWCELDRRTAKDMYQSPVYLYEIGNT